MADDLTFTAPSGRSFALGWLPDREAAVKATPQYARLYRATPRFDAPAGGLPRRFTLQGMRKYPFNQGPVGTCFPPGTRVRMADGSERSIEGVRLLDVVLTAEGRSGRVRQLMARDVDEPIVNLKLWGHAGLRMTEEHPVLTQARGYVAAKDLTTDDYVAMPRYLNAGESLRTVAFVVAAHHVKPGRSPIHRDRVVRYAGVVGRKSLDAKIRALPEIIRLTPGFGRIIGLFLAEGSTDHGKVVWTFADREEETLAADLVALLDSELGIEAHVVRKPSNHVCRVIVYGTHWAQLFESLCGTGAGLKRVHPWLFRGDEEFFAEVLRGWMDGDGSGRDGGLRGATVSEDLALAMFDVAQAAGMRPTLACEEPRVNKYAAARRPVWKVGCIAKDDNWRCEMTETHVYRKVREVGREDYAGPVYNLSVEGDESYVAEGIGVHNCWANAGTQVAQVMTAVAVLRGKPFEAAPLSRAYVGHYGCRLMGGGNPADGGTISAAMAAQSDPPGGFGNCHESLFPYEADRRYLGQAPPAAADADAAHFHIHQVSDLPYDVDNWRAAIYAGHPIDIGIAWPANFDDRGPFFDRAGMPVGGHSIIVYGWYERNGTLYWHFDNSHGDIYGVLESADFADFKGYDPALSPGYSAFCAERVMATHMAGGNAEAQVAADVDGFLAPAVDWSEALRWS